MTDKPSPTEEIPAMNSVSVALAQAWEQAGTPCPVSGDATTLAYAQR